MKTKVRDLPMKKVYSVSPTKKKESMRRALGKGSNKPTVFNQ